MNETSQIRAAKTSPVIRILFVCTGNICRSPMAEGVFRHLVEEAGLSGSIEARSAGTDSYHVGEKPDARAVNVAARAGVSLEGIRARKIHLGDFDNYDYIFAMDGGHIYELKEQAPERSRAKLVMFLAAASSLKEIEVPDPWYGAEEDFERSWKLISEGASALLKKIREDHHL